MPGRQQAVCPPWAPLLPDGVCCPPCTPPRSGGGSEQPAAGRGAAALHSRGRPGGDTPAHAGSHPAGTCLTRCLAPLASPRRLEPSRPLAAAGSQPAFCCRCLAWVRAALQRNPARMRLLRIRFHPRGGRRAHPQRNSTRAPPGTAEAEPGSSSLQAGTRGALQTSPLGSRESHFTLCVVCRVSRLIRVGIFGMEKPGSGSDCPARQSPAVNAADSTRACVLSGRVMGSVSLGSTT